MAISLEEVRRRILIAMFSDDELMDELVLKGGNALALRLSSLIELARTLDLELTLVPRQALPAVQSIVRSTAPSSTDGRETRQAFGELGRLGQAVAEHQSALPLKPEEVAKLQRQLRELGHFHLSDSDRKTIREANQSIKAYLHDKNNVNTLRQAVVHLNELRNALAHGAAHHTQQPEPVRPAYSLDEDENA